MEVQLSAGGCSALSHDDRERLRRFYDQPVAPRTITKVLALCGLEPGGDHAHLRALDFGCGGGRYLQVLSEAIPRENLVGLEADPERIDCVRELGFDCRQLDPALPQLPFETGSLDLVFSSNVVEHIPRPLYLAYLAEIARVLKPGARFVVGTPNYPIKRLYDLVLAVTSEHTRYYLWDDPTHCNRLSIRRLERDLRRHFDEVHLEPTRLFFESRIAWLRRERVRQRLRILGDKVAGYCVKAAAGGAR